MDALDTKLNVKYLKYCSEEVKKETLERNTKYEA